MSVSTRGPCGRRLVLARLGCGSRAVSVAGDTFGAMTAHPAEPVPDTDPDEAAVAAAALREYREWVAKGRPGAVSHEEAMAELLGDAQ